MRKAKFRSTGALMFSALVLMTSWRTAICAVEAEHVPGQVIVKLSADTGKLDAQSSPGVVSLGIPTLDRLMQKYGVNRVVPLFAHKNSELRRIYQLEYRSEDDPAAVAEDFSANDNVVYAVTRQVKWLCDLPDDPFYANGEQWYLNTVQGPMAWDIVHGDSAVIIAIVDTGVDWDHPDLWANIWFNRGEDVDGDGLVSWRDWNNIDDDGNGYRDDFFGWDFGRADNDPNEHAPVHGTHCAGIAAAATDNGLGVAGMSWNCTIMPVKANRDAENNIRWGYEGILYAADNGADVISLSWGNTSTDAYEQEVIDSAFARGAIIVAAAGNDPGVSPPDSCRIHYPAGNRHVTAVAATDVNDKITSWSYYGRWVDVAAPGAAIYNTWWNNTYVSIQGTSMSCPLVAGIAALLKVLDPGMDSDQFEAKMRHTSDELFEINPDYIGHLGGGRANAHAALLSLSQSRLFIDEEPIIDDADGNADGRADPGETVNWILTVSNTLTWQPAEDVWVKVSTADTSVTFLQDSTAFGPIQPGQSASNSLTPFRFFVSPGTPAHSALFTLQAMSGSPGDEMKDSLELMLGRPAVLLVDDDGGDDLEGPYQKDLNDLAVVFDIWGVAQKGQIDSSELGYYEAVIWLTGAQRESTLTSDDQAHLIGFLDGGGQLFLTGQNIGDEIGLGKFFSDYLRVGHLADTVQNFPPVVAGVAGDLIGDGAQLFLWGSNGPVPSPSAAEALEGANEVLFYQNDSQQRAAATRYESPQGYRVVYFGFGYETIRTAGAYTPGRQVLERILNWFGLETGPTEISPQVPETQPSGYALLKNYPNPFNTTTGIAYQLPGEAESQRTTLRVYNILGQEVRTLVDEIQGAGKYQVWWDGRDHSGVEVETGIYFYLLSSGAFRQLGKMVLLK